MPKPQLNLLPELTPNPNSLKILLNYKLLETGAYNFKRDEFKSDSALAEKIFEVAAVQEVFICNNFVSVTKAPEINWETILPSIANQIQKFHDAAELPVAKELLDSIEIKNNQKDAGLSDLERQIEAYLQEHIQPGIAADGGEVVFYGFEDGVVRVLMQGACGSCPSSKLTLKATIERQLKEHFPEVTEVKQL